MGKLQQNRALQNIKYIYIYICINTTIHHTIKRKFRMKAYNWHQYRNEKKNDKKLLLSTYIVSNQNSFCDSDMVMLLFTM